MVSILHADGDRAEARYEIVRTLGQGGAGAVYLVRDRDTGEKVALKKLLRMDQKSVLRLKREFRSLADMVHPNLVKLYDLGSADDGWFITMEFIDGPDLLNYLGLDPNRPAGLDLVSITRAPGLSIPHPSSGHERMLQAFRQLASGVSALHRAGMLHRDLKPSNVLVSNDRVVVLDFGLVHDLDGDSPLETQEGAIAGTPAYMAPEQALGQALSESSDWYALGVMLYQALSGELPIEGRSTVELLMRKNEVDPEPLDRLVPGIAPELSALCMRLLSRQPRERPDGEEILRVFERQTARFEVAGGKSQTLEFTTRTDERMGAAPSRLFGREREIQQLQASLAEAEQGTATVVHVRGASGAGKSALVEAFLAGLASAPGRSHGEETLVLRSRCYEREAMPFKALDGVMDALVKRLAQLDDFELGHLLPIDIPELAQLFPALQRLPGVERLLASGKQRGAAMHVRQRAEVGLRELFARLAHRQPIVLWIDDLQWGDLDSASILKSWRQELARAPILFVFSYRSDEITTSPCLRMLLKRDSEHPSSASSTEEQVIEVVALDEADVRALSEQRLGDLAKTRPDLVEQIARESRGNPFLVSQLAALVHARLGRGQTELTALSMEQLIVQARELLPPGAAHVLSALAIAGRPIAAKIALRAAGVPTEGRALLHALRALRLIRSRDVAGQQLIEVYHDRVREGAQASLSESERAHVHESLLHVLEADGSDDADWMHSLALGAGQPALALQHGLVAAERASSVLAFERAAELYATCLRLRAEVVANDNAGGPAPERGQLYTRLGDALARSRHGVRAAEAYLEAAKLVPREAAVGLMRKAASHLVRSGEFARGEAIVRDVLSELRLSLPESETGLLAAIAWERAALALRGLEYRPRPAEDVPEEVARKVDLFITLSVENQAHDPLRAALMQARCLRWALGSGDRRLIARALCVSATMTCVSGSERAERQSRDMLDRATAIASELGNELLLGNVLSARAVCGFLLGLPGEVLEYGYEAERISRAHSEGDAEGDYYHRFTVVAVRTGALNLLGEHHRAIAELSSTLLEARATNNRSAALHLALVQTILDEVQNQAVLAKARLEDQRKLLPSERFGTLHLLHMLALMRASCATGDYAWSERWIEEDWARWKRSPVRVSAFLTLLSRGVHARYLLNRHVIERRTGNPLTLVQEDLRALGRLPSKRWRTVAQARIRARLAFLAGDRVAAAEQLRLCQAEVRDQGLADEDDRDTYALGFVLGGEEGRALRLGAERSLRERGVVDPLANLQSHYPEVVIAG